MKSLVLVLSLSFSVTLLAGCAHWGAKDPHAPPPAPPNSEQPSGAPGGTSPVGELRE